MLKHFLLSCAIFFSVPVSARVTYLHTLPDGVEFKSDGVMTRLQVVTPEIIRVSSTPGEFPEDSSLIVLPYTSKGFLSLKSTPYYAILSTKKVIVKVNMEDGIVKFYDNKGHLLLSESAGGKSFTPVTVEGTDGYTVTQSFESLNDDEGFYGLGQHQANEFNYKGKNEELFQYNTKVSMPFVVSTDNYGILWDSYSFCRWGRPEDYRQLGEVFRLFDSEGNEGFLTGRYTASDGKEMIRQEPQIYFEHLIRGDLNHVVNLPRDFKFNKSKVVYEGEIEPLEDGRYDFILYYSGYQTVYIDNKKVVDERWRTSWNPNSYKFSVELEKGKRVPLKIEWEPNGAVAYCGLRVYPPVADSERNKMIWWGEMQDMIDYYFIYGQTPDEIISGYRTLTGKAPVMPKWAMGFWQSREKYNDSKQVLSTVNEFRKRNIPLDNIVIDWLHWKQDSWGSHEFDPARFPDPKGMVDSIHALDARVMVSVWPKFYVTTEHYKEFDRNGWMYQGAVRDSILDWVGKGYLGSFYDAYNPEARKLFWSQMNDHYVPLGIDAWWMDASEPNIRDCIDIQYRKDLMTPTYLGPSAKYFNAYALMNAEAIYDGQRGVDPDRRVFLLTRSGFPGLQRYSTATWSGDIATRWEDMEAQIAAGLNFSISGIPFWTMDIGGFCVEDRYVRAQKLFDKTGEENDDLKEWRELNSRWYQFGAFVPLFRAHGQWPFREAYNIAPEGDPAYNSITKHIRLRYTLMPYIYSLAAMAHYDDYTLMRPLVMDFTADRKVRNIKDQYMFGPALMIAPVYKYGQRSRTVYLPAGAKWYDFHSGKQYEGGKEIEADAPYDRIPVFIKGGSIIPSGGEIMSTAQKAEGPMTISIYTGADGSFTLYEDDGVTYDYEKGIYSMIPFSYDESDRLLTIGNRQGSYETGSRQFEIVVFDGVSVTGSPLNAAGQMVEYDGKEIKIKL